MRTPYAQPERQAPTIRDRMMFCCEDKVLRQRYHNNSVLTTHGGAPGRKRESQKRPRRAYHEFDSPAPGGWRLEAGPKRTVPKNGLVPSRPQSTAGSPLFSPATCSPPSVTQTPHTARQALSQQHHAVRYSCPRATPRASPQEEAGEGRAEASQQVWYSSLLSVH